MFIGPVRGGDSNRSGKGYLLEGIIGFPYPNHYKNVPTNKTIKDGCKTLYGVTRTLLTERTHEQFAEFVAGRSQRAGFPIFASSSVPDVLNTLHEHYKNHLLNLSGSDNSIVGFGAYLKYCIMCHVMNRTSGIYSEIPKRFGHLTEVNLGSMDLCIDPILSDTVERNLDGPLFCAHVYNYINAYNNAYGKPSHEVLAPTINALMREISDNLSNPFNAGPFLHDIDTYYMTVFEKWTMLHLLIAQYLYQNQENVQGVLHNIETFNNTRVIKTVNIDDPKFQENILKIRQELNATRDQIDNFQIKHALGGLVAQRPRDWPSKDHMHEKFLARVAATKIEELRKQLADRGIDGYTTKQHQQRVKEIRDSYNGRITDMERTNRHLLEDKQRQIDAYVRRFEIFQKAGNVSGGDLTRLQRQLDTANDAKRKLQTDVLRSENTAQLANNRIKDMQTQLQRCQRKLEGLEKQRNVSGGDPARLQRQLNAAIDAKMKLQTDVLRSENTAQLANTHIKNMQTQLQRCQRKLEGLEKQRNVSDGVIRDLRIELLSARTETQTAKNRIDDFIRSSRQYERKCERLEKQVNQLRGPIMGHSQMQPYSIQTHPRQRNDAQCINVPQSGEYIDMLSTIKNTTTNIQETLNKENTARQEAAQKLENTFNKYVQSKNPGIDLSNSMDIDSGSGSGSDSDFDADADAFEDAQSGMNGDSDDSDDFDSDSKSEGEQKMDKSDDSPSNFQGGFAAASDMDHSGSDDTSQPKTKRSTWTTNV